MNSKAPEVKVSNVENNVGVISKEEPVKEK